MELHLALISLGGLFVAGMLTDVVARRTGLPRVTILILLGVAVGPVGFDILPSLFDGWYGFLSTTALTMVAFLLGGSLTRAQLHGHGRHILYISLFVVVTTLVFVGFGMTALGVPLVMALLLAGISTATDPAATQDVIGQYDARGGFVDTLRGIVAIDDAWAIILFSIILVLANTLQGQNGVGILQEGVWEILGAVLVGTCIGLPAAFLSGRLRPGEPIQSEALAVIFLCSGISIWLEVSYLLSGIVAGAIVVNVAQHHRIAFHEIKHIERPFMVLFFVLAGAALQPDHWGDLVWIVAGFIGLRALSRMVGGWIGARVSSAPVEYSRWIGIALMPQAGIALGMALVAGNEFPELRETILSIAIASTMVFEVLGPLATRLAIYMTRAR